MWGFSISLGENDVYYIRVTLTAPRTSLFATISESEIEKAFVEVGAQSRSTCKKEIEHGMA
jgi:hypothetical protein